MKEIDLGKAVGMLANIGVLAGIVFLGVEIRQNTRSQEISAYQDVLAQIARLSELTIENEEISDTAFNSPEALDFAGGLAEWQFLVLLFRTGDSAFYLGEQGVISEERLQSALNVLRVNVCSPNPRAAWSIQRSGFTEKYQQYVDALIERC